MATDELLIPQPRRFPRWWIVAVAGGILVVAGALLWRTFQGSAPPQQYLTAPVQRTELADTVAATGPIAAARAVPLNFKNSGKVAEIDVKVGDSVTAGQLLAKLDPTDLQLQLRQTQANLSAAQAKLEGMLAGPRAGQTAQLQASVDDANRKLAAMQRGPRPEAIAQAQSNLKSAQAKLDQLKAGPTAAGLAAAQTAVDQANASVASAQAKLDQLKAGPASSEISAAQAAVNQAKSALTSAEDKYEMASGNNLADSGYSSVSAAQQAYDAAKANYASAVQKLQQLQTGPLPADLQTARSNLDSAGAGLASAQAQLTQLKAGPTREDLDQAQAAVDAAQAQLTLAQNPYTDDDFQQARGNAWAAEQALKLAQEPYTRQDIDGARAQVAAQQALVDLAQANLEAATLTAPSAGVVTALSGAVGQWLAGGSTSGAAASAASGANNSSSNGATTFINLTDLGDLQIQAQVNEADVGRLKPGQPVTFTVDAFPGQTLKGSVAVVQPLGSSSQNVVSYPVLISIEPNQARLLPGMTANVTIAVSSRPDVLVVPAAAISFAQAQITSGGQSSAGAPANAGPAVLLVDSAGKATVHPVRTSASSGQYTEVISGLEVGQQVAVGVRGK